MEQPSAESNETEEKIVTMEVKNPTIEVKNPTIEDKKPTVEDKKPMIEDKKPTIEDKKPTIEEPVKSSMEILSELFSTFDAEPPVIIKKEKTDEDGLKKHKKSKKKKHKHKEKKDKKHKKKDKKRKRSSSEASEIDLANLLIKEERKSPEKKVKLEVVNDEGVPKIKKEPPDDVNKPKSENDTKKESDASIKSDVKSNKDKIVIKNLKFSSIFEATIEQIKKKDVEEGELMESDGSVSSSELKKSKKHKHHRHNKHDDSKKKSKCSHKSRSKEREKSTDRKSRESDDRDKKREHRSRDRSSVERSYYYNDMEHKKYKSFWHRDEKYKDKKYSSDDYRERDFDDFYKSRKAKDDDFYRSKDLHKEEKWFMKDRYRGYNGDREKKRKDRERSTSRDSTSHIDKKKLLEIARKNAIQMMKSGSLPGALSLGPQAQEKVIAAIKAGGKTIEELTDFCKALSKKEEAGDLSSVSDANSDSDSERPFHHPFQIKDRPTSITMNIKNSIPLPIKSTHERTAELRMQFPVSSGQQHRKTESEWVPVSPKKVETSVPKVSVDVPAIKAAPLPIQPAPSVPTNMPAPENSLNPLPGPQVFPNSTAELQAVNIGQIVSQRLTAMRKLQENPLDVQAITQMYKAQKEMQTWAESKQQPGQFTGTTGAQILSQAELSSGYQAWARKDQLQNAAPVSGGMGMHLLQKMGWRPGEGLGKEKTGALEPLLLEVKLDKKGLVANEEQKKKQVKPQKVTVKAPQAKHPVSLLGEYASKNKLGAPQYSLCFECGPDHKKNFLFQVVLNGIVYKPNVASPNKKDAKANAATVCLQTLGLLP